MKAKLFRTKNKTLLYRFRKDQGTVEDYSSYLHCQTALPQQGKGRKKHLDIGIWADDEPCTKVNHCNKSVAVGIEIKHYWERIITDTIVENVLADIAISHGD